MIISYRLPALDGTGGIYSSVKRTAASVASWGIGLFLAVWCWRWFARRFFLICGIVFIMFAAILGDAAMGMTEKMQVTDTVDNVLSNLAFHPKDNVIIIVADALPTFAVEEVLPKRIDIKRK